MKIGGLRQLSLLDFPGRVACTVFLSGCNLRCPYCHNPSLVLLSDKPEALSQQALLAFLDTRRGKLDGVCISGGEPTLHKEEGGKYAVYHFKGVPQLLFMVYPEIFCRYLT